MAERRASWVKGNLRRFRREATRWRSCTRTKSGGRHSLATRKPSGRGNHSFIGVFDPATKILRYLDPSVDRDSEPAWSPDSREIAFLRIPASADLFAFG